jgi:hypothetical protein
MPFCSTPARRAIALCCAVGTFGAAGLASAAPSATLAPSDDTYASAVQAHRNFGAAKRLVVAHGPNSFAFLRFALGSAPAAGFHATLRLYPLTSSPKGLRVRRATGTGWAERTLIFGALPATDHQAMVRTGALRARRWKEVDVTRLVDDSGVLSLALATSGRQRIVLASREAGAQAPRLVVRNPAGTANVAPSASEPQAATAGPGPAPADSPASQPAPVPPPVPPGPAPGPQPTPDKPCGVTSTPPAWQHVVWIVMENHSYGQVMNNAQTPFTTSLAQKCGSATNMSAEARPSLPNYIAMTSGGTQGIADNNPPSSHPLNVPNIFQLTGGNWLSPQESMPSNCAQNSSGSYAVKHNPAAYYTNIRTECMSLNVPMSDPVDVSKKFTLITPNMCNSTHDCDVATGDRWLSKYITQILGSAAYRSGTTALFLTWDEGSGDQHIATLVVSPSTVPGTNNGTAYNHYSMLRATEEMLGLSPLIGQAAGATSMRAGFNL